MSISEDKNVPELRFKGYTENWEQRKLGELSNIVGGGTPSTSNPEYWDGDIDWYAPAEIGEQSYVNKSKKTITELGLKKSSARILPVGTVLFTSRAGIGNTAILAKEATTNQGFQSIVPDQNKLDSYFIFSRTNELKRYGEVTGAGSTFVEVSGKQMSKMPIMAPVLSEQQEIGTFFEQIDNTITLHQEKLSKLYALKEAYLQQMFPQYKENNPKVRFTNFGEKWQKSKLSEVLNVNSGRDYKHLKSGDVPVYGTGGYMLSVDQCLSDEDAIGIGRKGTIDKPQYLKSPFWTVDTLFYMKVKKGYDLLFVYSISQTVRWKKYDESTGVPSLSKTTINNITKTFPPYKEQVAIGKFFDKINELIDLEQIKLDKLKNLKKAYLRKMFI